MFVVLHSDMTYHTETVIKTDDVCARDLQGRRENDFSERASAETNRQRKRETQTQTESRTNEVDIKGRQEGEGSLVAALGTHRGHWVGSQGVYN